MHALTHSGSCCGIHAPAPLKAPLDALISHRSHAHMSASCPTGNKQPKLRECFWQGWACRPDRRHPVCCLPHTATACCLRLSYSSLLLSGRSAGWQCPGAAGEAKSMHDRGDLAGRRCCTISLLPQRPSEEQPQYAPGIFVCIQARTGRSCRAKPWFPNSNSCHPLQ